MKSTSIAKFMCSNKAICLQDAQNVWRQQLPQAVQCKSQFIQQVNFQKLNIHKKERRGNNET